MKIIYVTETVFDAFTGDGWENWSRWTSRDGKLHQIGGKENQFMKYKLAKHFKENKNGA